MMKVLDVHQIRAADAFTIQKTPISSIQLMERASQAFVRKFLSLFTDKKPIKVFCSTGNNGGDGLAIARILQGNNWDVSIFVVGTSTTGSSDFLANLKRVDTIKEIHSHHDFPICNNEEIIIDGLFGTGLTRPVDGICAALINYLNQKKTIRIAIDIASGLFADDPTLENTIFKPHHTISFQIPKKSFFLTQNKAYVGKLHIVDIGLSSHFLEKESTDMYYTQSRDVRPLIPIRDTQAHKNTVGRLLIVSGSKGKMGAAMLCAQAAFRSGVGLIEVHIPKCGTSVFQSVIPEVMVLEDNNQEIITHVNIVKHTIAIGPGIGTQKKTVQMMGKLLAESSQPLVLDADAINIISKHKKMITLLPKESILTPHEGEFKRLVGAWENNTQKLEMLQHLCLSHHLNIVLKGINSAVCNSQGEIHFNSTGNSVLATAGSGDVLTGIVASLLAQGLKPFDALKLGVFIHGFSGDILSKVHDGFGMIASDIIKVIPEAFASLKGQA